jgi:uncharacterized membrane protein YsdA (DUF1294 family)
MNHVHSTFYLCLNAYYVLASGIALLAMGHDKLAARSQRQRIAENNLHLLSAAGGWPGAWLACLLFRHKIRKPRFQVCQVVAALANLALLAMALNLYTSY